MSDDNLLANAAALAGLAGWPAPGRLEQLAGGKNNRVFRAILPDGKSLVLKSYFADPRDPRDRLGAEWAFLSYAWRRGVRAIPEPLAHDVSRHLSLFTLLPGYRLTAGEITPYHVTAAADFVLAVNGAPREPLTMPPGSEACFSIAQHIATVQRRVDRLANLDPNTPLYHMVEYLVSERLAPAWNAVRTKIIKTVGSRYDIILAPEDVIVSPSDFGFHNALVEPNGVGFLDFEYAGRDDPAKLICDFFCQPEVPVPVAFFPSFVDRIVRELGLKPWDRERCAVLLDLYRIKWACIILNPFLPVGAARRAFAETASWLDLCAGQLARAERKLAEIEA